jgi:hypothetical protein
MKQIRSSSNIPISDSVSTKVSFLLWLEKVLQRIFLQDKT